MRYRSGLEWIRYFVFIIIWSFLIFVIRYGILIASQEETSSSVEDVIVWHDKGLEAAIKSAMGLSIEENVAIAKANEWPGEWSTSYGMYYLILEGEDIKNIEDLKYFTNLRKLVLKDINISDLSPLLLLEKLEGLEIYGGSIKELDIIGKMENLVLLSIYDVPVNSILPLKNMNHLNFLYLGDLPLDNISVLGLMGEELYELTLERLPLIDVEELKYLVNLHELIITEVPVEKIPLLPDSVELITLKKTNVSELSGIPDSVRSLSLWGNQILDFSLLCSLPKLTYLHITESNLSNQNSPLSFEKLEHLFIKSCNLLNLNFLGDCAELETLILEDSGLESICGIKKFTSLDALMLSNNKLQRIEGLELLPRLTLLDLSKNPVQDLSPLTDIPSLKGLNLSSINLKDVQLDGLLNCPDLQALFLDNCGLKDIKFMKEFHSLRNVHISNNQISDISDIVNMYTPLTLNEVVLDLSYNPIRDLTPLAKCEKFSHLNLSGIDMKNVEGLGELRDLHILRLTAEECNLDSINQISVISETKGGVGVLSLANNRLKELSLIENDGWRVYELDVSGNLITEDYLKKFGAFKVGPGRYKYGRYVNINIYRE